MFKRSDPPGRAKNKRAAAAGRASGIRASAAGLALLTAACGGGATGAGGGGQTSEGPAPAGGLAEAGGAVTEASAPSDGEDQPETLGEYLGYDIDDPDAAAAADAENRRRVEETVARCMAQEGFEYIPAVRPVPSSLYEAFDREEYARSEGFGITTWYGRENRFDPKAADDWVDPNLAIVEALSDSERKAYDAVLYGAPTEKVDVDPESGAAAAGDPYGGGCNGQAYREVYGKQDELWEQLGPKWQELWERLEADPRYQEADGGWKTCMADRGYRYDGVDQMYDEIWADFGDRFDAIVGEGGGWADPFEGWSEERLEAFLAENSEEEIEDFYEQAQSEARANVDQEALAALQQEERDLAVANYECSRNMMETIEELQREYEGRFVRENRDLLEQMRS